MRGIRFEMDSLTPDLAVRLLADAKRIDRGVQIPRCHVVPAESDIFLVKSQSGNGTYTVDLRGHGSCTCPDWTYRQVECKHIKAARALKGGES